MHMQDVLVGFVAAGLGLLFVASAVAGEARLLRFAKPRMLAAAFGQTAARVLLALLGAALIALGAAVALGWRVNWG
jgi:hypothetical protein